MGQFWERLGAITVCPQFRPGRRNCALHYNVFAALPTAEGPSIEKAFGKKFSL